MAGKRRPVTVPKNHVALEVIVPAPDPAFENTHARDLFANLVGPAGREAKRRAMLLGLMGHDLITLVRKLHPGIDKASPRFKEGATLFTQGLLDMLALKDVARVIEADGK